MMKKYLTVCRIAQEQHLLWKLGDRHHMIDTTYMYSLQDLMDTHLGELPAFLETVYECFIKHIKEDCAICIGRGHLCEICGNDEVIFPFEAATVSCTKCNAVFHRICWTRKKQCCPKCTRLERRKQNEEHENGGKLEEKSSEIKMAKEIDIKAKELQESLVVTKVENF